MSAHMKNGLIAYLIVVVINIGMIALGWRQSDNWQGGGLFITSLALYMCGFYQGHSTGYEKKEKRDDRANRSNMG